MSADHDLQLTARELGLQVLQLLHVLLGFLGVRFEVLPHPLLVQPRGRELDILARAQLAGAELAGARVAAARAGLAGAGIARRGLARAEGPTIRVRSLLRLGRLDLRLQLAELLRARRRPLPVVGDEGGVAPLEGVVVARKVVELCRGEGRR